MKTILVLSFLMAGCSHGNSEKSEAAFRRNVTPKMETFALCMDQYGREHAKASAEPLQVGEAGAGACSSEYREMEEAMIREFQSGVTMDYRERARVRGETASEKIRRDAIRQIAADVVNAR